MGGDPAAGRDPLRGGALRGGSDRMRTSGHYCWVVVMPDANRNRIRRGGTAPARVEIPSPASGRSSRCTEGPRECGSYPTRGIASLVRVRKRSATGKGRRDWSGRPGNNGATCGRRLLKCGRIKRACTGARDREFRMPGDRHDRKAVDRRTAGAKRCIPRRMVVEWAFFLFDSRREYGAASALGVDERPTGPALLFEQAEGSRQGDASWRKQASGVVRRRQGIYRGKRPRPAHHSRRAAEHHHHDGLHRHHRNGRTVEGALVEARPRWSSPVIDETLTMGPNGADALKFGGSSRRRRARPDKNTGGRHAARASKGACAKISVGFRPKMPRLGVGQRKGLTARINRKARFREPVGSHGGIVPLNDAKGD